MITAIQIIEIRDLGNKDTYLPPVFIHKTMCRDLNPITKITYNIKYNNVISKVLKSVWTYPKNPCVHTYRILGLEQRQIYSIYIPRILTKKSKQVAYKIFMEVIKTPKYKKSTVFISTYKTG